MAIPDYQTIMTALLKYASDGEEHTFEEAVDYLAKQFNLTEDELKE